jgi:hypothetical protein
MAWALAALVRSCCHAAITAGGEFHPALRTLVFDMTPNPVNSRHSAFSALSRGLMRSWLRR